MRPRRSWPGIPKQLRWVPLGCITPAMWVPSDLGLCVQLHVCPALTSAWTWAKSFTQTISLSPQGP